MRKSARGARPSSKLLASGDSSLREQNGKAVSTAELLRGVLRGADREASAESSGAEDAVDGDSTGPQRHQHVHGRQRAARERGERRRQQQKRSNPSVNRPSLILEDPLQRRHRALQAQTAAARKFLEKARQCDPLGFLTSMEKSEGTKPSISTSDTPAKPMTLSTIFEKMDEDAYEIIGAISDEAWTMSRKIVELLERRNEYGERKLLKREDLVGFNWDSFEDDLRAVWESALAKAEIEERNLRPLTVVMANTAAPAFASDTSDFRAQSLKDAAMNLHSYVEEQIPALRRKYEESLDRIQGEERLDRLSFENLEPAMAVWRKQPLERREYTHIDYYKPASGIPLEEQDELLKKLQAPEGTNNMWVVLEENDEEPMVAGEGEAARKTKRQSISEYAARLPHVSWDYKVIGEDLTELESWGIDAFTRRNLCISLEQIEEPSLKMTQPQINWFIEGLLLRELNQQNVDVACDITHALEALKCYGLERIEKRRALEKLRVVEDNGVNVEVNVKRAPETAPAIVSTTEEEADAADSQQVEKREDDVDSESHVKNSEKGEPKTSLPTSKRRLQSIGEREKEGVQVQTQDDKVTSAPKRQRLDSSQHLKKEVSKNEQCSTGAVKLKQSQSFEEKDIPVDEDNDSILLAVEKIEEATRKKKRLIDVGHENIIWTSHRRERKKPEFFEAIPKEKRSPAASKSNRKPKKKQPPALKRPASSSSSLSSSSRSTRKTRKNSEVFEAEEVPKKAPASKKRRLERKSPAEKEAKSRKDSPVKTTIRKEKCSEIAHQDEFTEEDAYGESTVGKRITVFWPSECVWYAGHIIAFEREPKEAGKHHCVRYDDGEEEWVDIIKERCMIEDVNTTNYDKNLSDEQIIEGAETILRHVAAWGLKYFYVHSKGVGVICSREGGIKRGDLLGSYYGELYPLWLWELKEAREDASRKKLRGKSTLPDFWNMRLEIPASEDNGFEMMYVDAKHFGTSMSRLSHCCRPNTCVMLAIIDGQYRLSMRALRDIEPGEEITIDYNCITDSMDEFRAAICLCGSEGCRGSFLYITGAEQYMQVVGRRHRTVHRLAMLYEASFAGPTDDEHGLEVEIVQRLEKYGFKLEKVREFPDWCLRYCDMVLHFVEQELRELPVRLYLSEFARREKLAIQGFNGVQTGGAAGKTGPRTAVPAPASVVASPIGSSPGTLNVGDVEEESETIELSSEAKPAKRSPSGKKKSGKRKASKPSLKDQQEVVLDLWKTVKRDSRGIAQQRASHLLIALSKLKHRMATRIRLGVQLGHGGESGARHLELDMGGNDAQSLEFAADHVEGDWRFQMSPAHGETRVETHLNKVCNLVETTFGKLRERLWWVGDRCEAKWCADDAADYPGWYIGTILKVYPRGLEENNPKTGVKSSNEEEIPAGEIEPVSKKFREMMKTVPSVHFLYDDGQVIDRIPTAPEVIRRPEQADAKDFNGKLTALSLRQHQSPFRPIPDAEIMESIWNDNKNSIMRRVLRLCEKHCVLNVHVWQSAADPRNRKPYWWNVKTKEIASSKPSAEQLEESFEFVPKALGEMRVLALHAATKFGDIKHGLEQLREHVLALPAISSKQWKIFRDPKLDDALQKVADLLTLLAHTRHFFAVLEPIPSKSSKKGAAARSRPRKDKESHESSVVAALLGWVDQKEEGLEPHELLGTAALPEVESAFLEVDSAKYLSYVRNRLIRHLSDSNKRYNEWDQDVRKMFPDDLLAGESTDLDEWPPPMPPHRLFGSPALDAALVDNREFQRVTFQLSGTASDLRSKKLLSDLTRQGSIRANQIFDRLVSVLRSTRRSNGRVPKEEMDLVAAPPAPAADDKIVWIQCGKPNCKKWRKLPAGLGASDFPEDFVCAHLHEVDPPFADCSFPEEPSNSTEPKWGFGVVSVDDLAVGHRVDGFSRRGRRWFPANIVAIRDDAVLVRFETPSHRADEWLPRHPVSGEPPSLMPLHTFTSRSVNRSRRVAFSDDGEMAGKDVSPHGPKVSAADYNGDFPKGVAEVVADLVNQVSEENGEPLGKTETRTRRDAGNSRLSGRRGGSSTASSTSKSGGTRTRDKGKLAQREAMYAFFRQMKRLHGGLITYEHIMSQMNEMTQKQISLWNPSAWNGNTYSGWLDADLEEDVGLPTIPTDEEPDEAFVMVGMKVKTPNGLGIVMERTGVRTYRVAVKARPGMRTWTPYGEGTVHTVDLGSGVAAVHLSWGATLFAPDLPIVFEYFLAVPVEPMIFTKVQKRSLQGVLGRT